MDFLLPRREFLKTLAAGAAAFCTPSQFASAEVAAGKSSGYGTAGDLPDPTTFQSGDFVWSKKKGAVIWKKAGEPPSVEQGAWEEARNRLLLEDPVKSGLSPEAAQKLRDMSFADFEALYFSGPIERVGQGQKGRSSASLGNISVGHVGIIEINSVGIYVIEANITPAFSGVQRTLYSEWLKKTEIQIWHGRVAELSEEVRKRVAAEAVRQINKPYNFFNFDLDDDSGFYCSKLAWMSVWRATAAMLPKPLAVDDNRDPKRTWLGWFSPKQLLHVAHVQCLHAPTEY